MSDCVSFAQDGSDETDKFDVERKSFDLLKDGTSRRSAAEQLDIIGFGCFAQYSWHLDNKLGPTGFIM